LDDQVLCTNIETASMTKEYIHLTGTDCALPSASETPTILANPQFGTIPEGSGPVSAQINAAVTLPYSVSITSQPMLGSVSVDRDKLIYTAPQSGAISSPTAIEFGYRISDVNGYTAGLATIIIEPAAFSATNECRNGVSVDGYIVECQPPIQTSGDYRYVHLLPQTVHVWELPTSAGIRLLWTQGYAKHVSVSPVPGDYLGNHITEPWCKTTSVEGEIKVGQYPYECTPSLGETLFFNIGSDSTNTDIYDLQYLIY
jgi:hypothetical protein